MTASARNTILIVVGLLLMFLLWKLFKGFLVVLMLGGIAALLVYIIIKMPKKT